MKKTELENMKVAELKQMSRERGLTLESNGHKFNKSELIERLLQSQDEQNDIEKKIEEAGTEDNEKWDEPVLEHKETKSVVKEQDGYIKYAKTVDEVEKKYSNPKRDFVYDNFLKVGSFVVFIHYVEALDTNVYKKLRTAKVVAVNRGKRLVRVETLLGTQLELSFDELLYIKDDRYKQEYPKDIDEVLRNQRTRKGRELINERFNNAD